MFSSVYLCGICSLILIGAVQSSYNVFTYKGDDGDDDEHCCLVQLDDKFCLAQVLTNSLIQVDRDCQRLNANEKSKTYLSKVVRRLTVESSEKVGDQILIELEKPLDGDILQKDLLCLTTENNNNNINLQKCYIILANVEKKRSKRKTKNETAEESTNDQAEVQSVDLAEALQIYQDQGVAVRQTFQLDLVDVEPKTRKEREYWSWYRTNTKKICNQPQKTKKTCIPYTDQNANYLQQIFNSTTGENDEFSPPLTVTKGSKLFCENNSQQTRLLGYYQESRICFQATHQIYIEHDFTDFVSLSNVRSNQRVLQFISNNSKLTNQYEQDCKDKTTLADIKKALEQEAEAKAAAKAADEAKKKAKAEAKAAKKAAAKAEAEAKAAAKAAAKAETKCKREKVEVEAKSTENAEAKAAEQETGSST
ncbi:unnamed protein product [Adineta ricciae]|uniref:Uncharacterized protein n=1 Tax=Adineta ricciae TaxID=249248 RepID=A0A814S8T8_ADIRI|nr:unnamed protein product [Adineta ricciae]